MVPYFILSSQRITSHRIALHRITSHHAISHPAVLTPRPAQDLRQPAELPRNAGPPKHHPHRQPHRGDHRVGHPHHHRRAPRRRARLRHRLQDERSGPDPAGRRSPRHIAIGALGRTGWARRLQDRRQPRLPKLLYAAGAQLLHRPYQRPHGLREVYPPARGQ